ncbi:T9SS type A sorting domain-containing protein [Hymenobacter weizhouensis]|uniref:T9SS type A sorting domain-containing protein n=1 Tax=Hymenobacter sp. YIM 151500-1 TaxID=2987689 RepID=UPI002226F7B1|nr:T9SS type A sorting domain-containing protein [Hymenobacter sp. YIM 151500-1]UYZ63625.1 T9SS type A sorting domain-containing protein [Hymenobacter sp. YIM 151500-1]
MKTTSRMLALSLSSLLLSTVAWAQGSTSSVGSDGFLRVNGQKFFPVGYYSGPSLQAKDLPAATQAMHDAGFTWFYASGNDLASTQAFLEQAQTLGLKVSLAGAGYNNEANYSAILTAFKDYPAIFSWEVADDAGYIPIKSFPARIRRYHQLAKAADPNRLTFMTGLSGLLNNADSTRIYTGIADYAALQWYPLFYKPGRRGYTYQDRTSFDAIRRWCTAAQQQGKAGTIILQTYWKSDQADDPSYESPAGEQLRAQSYAALLAGAKGVTYYSYYDERSNGPIDVKQPALWRATADFAAKMKSTLAEVVLNGTQTLLAEQSNTAYVHAAYWTYNNERYLVVVNLNTNNVLDNGQRTVSFATGLAGTMTALFNDYPATLSKTAAGTVSGTMQPLEVQVYRITPAPTTTTFYRLKNRWQNTYLYDNGDRASYSATASGDTYLWAVEQADGFSQFRNKATGDYLHVQTGQDYVECTAANAGWWSKDWAVEDYAGHKMLRNRWQANQYVHVEQLRGYAQHTSISKGTWSSQWTLEAARTSTRSTDFVTTTPTSATGIAYISATLSAYPNPSPDGRATLRLTARQAQRAVVQVYNQQGQFVSLLTVPLREGQTEFRLPAMLLQGTYYLTTRIDGQPRQFTLKVE